MFWPKPRMVYRSMGVGPGPDRVGAGVMDKAGIGVDHLNYRAPTYSLVYVLRGRGSYIDEHGRSFELGPGSCFQRLPGVLHTTTCPDPHSRWLEGFYDLGPTLYAGLAAMHVIRPEPRVFDRGLDEAVARRLDELCSALERASERRLPELCVELVAEVVHAQVSAVAALPAKDDEIERACRTLGDHCAERVNLRDWCEREGLDYERFRKHFQQKMGVSPGQYRIRRRLDRACQLLQTTDHSIDRIAGELGYSSPYEFSAQFSRRMGMPPSRYRLLGRPPA